MKLAVQLEIDNAVNFMINGVGGVGWVGLAWWVGWVGQGRVSWGGVGCWGGGG